MKTTTAKILEVMADGKGRTAAEVIASLPGCNPNTVRQKLSLLRTSGSVVGSRLAADDNDRIVTYTLARKPE